MMRVGRAVALATTLALVGCLPAEAVRSERPPAEVGGRFTFGGFVTGGGESTYGYTGKRGASEEALREQGRKFDKTVWQGVLIGAVAGTVIGAVAGGNAQDAVGGAIVGGSIGALAGMYIANKQKLYANAEDQLESMIADVNASNRDAEALLADAKRVLAEDRRRLEAVAARLHAGQATESELSQARARAWDNRKVVATAAVGARDQYRLFDGAKRGFLKQNPGVAPQSLDEELSAYRRNIDMLDSVVTSMGKA